MFRKSIMAILAGTALVVTAPALAEKPTEGIWAKGGGQTNAKVRTKDKANVSARGDARTNSQGSVNASETGKANADQNSALSTGADTTVDADSNVDANVNTNANGNAGANSQGAVNANVRAVERANANSALAAGAVASASLPGLTTGLNVKTSAGASLGTVSQVVTGTDGSIRLVIVTDASGKTHRLMPNQLNISGGVVTTTQAGIGG